MNTILSRLSGKQKTQMLETLCTAYPSNFQMKMNPSTETYESSSLAIYSKVEKLKTLCKNKNPPILLGDFFIPFLVFYTMSNLTFILISLVFSFVFTLFIMPYGIRGLIRWKMGKQIRSE